MHVNVNAEHPSSLVGSAGCVVGNVTFQDASGNVVFKSGREGVGGAPFSISCAGSATITTFSYLCNTNGGPNGLYPTPLFAAFSALDVAIGGCSDGSAPVVSGSMGYDGSNTCTLARGVTQVGYMDCGQNGAAMSNCNYGCTPGVIPCAAMATCSIQPDGLPGVLDVTTLDGANGFALVGSPPDPTPAASPSMIGDINNDGADDFCVCTSVSCYVVFGSVGATFPAVLALTGFSGINGFSIVGTNSASRAGDINCDGIADVSFSTATGFVILYGRNDAAFPASVNPESWDDALGPQLSISNEDSVSCSTSSVGDINDDGFRDSGVICGLNLFVLFATHGGYSSGSITLDGSNGFSIQGCQRAWSYGSDFPADVNGDGIDDLAVICWGRVAVVYGVSGWSAGTSAVDVRQLNGQNGFAVTDASGEAFGQDGDIGDFNGDGFADVVVGDPKGQPSGPCYIVFGGPRVPASVDVGQLNGGNGCTIAGFSGCLDSCWEVSSAGDVNGDGIADVIIGAQGSNKGIIMFGFRGDWPAQLSMSSMNDGVLGTTLTTSAAGLNLGWGAGPVGDIDGDGFADVGLSASTVSGALGTAYVILGDGASAIPSPSQTHSFGATASPSSKPSPLPSVSRSASPSFDPFSLCANFKTCGDCLSYRGVSCSMGRDLLQSDRDPLPFTSESQYNSYYDTYYCGWCWHYSNGNPAGNCIANTESDRKSCERSGNIVDISHFGYSGTSNCPVAEAGMEYGAYMTIAWLCSTGLLILGVLPALHFLRIRDVKSLCMSEPEAVVLFAWRVGILRIVFGALALGGTYALVSSTLTLCGGAVTVSTMRSLTAATRIVDGRSRNCSHPLHGANLSIAAVVFSVIEACAMVPLLIWQLGGSTWVAYISKWYFSPFPTYSDDEWDNSFSTDDADVRQYGNS